VYLDDVIVSSRTFQEQLLNLWKVFHLFREAHLKLAQRSAIFQREIRYLRHIVSLEGITTGPVKPKALQEWPTLENKHGIRSVLGLCAYYRRFISNFANVAKPLTKLTEEKQAFQWTPEVEAAFQALKETLFIVLFLPTHSQERGSLLTQTRVMSGLEDCCPKYRTDRRE
jgi:hypothetical protein